MPKYFCVCTCACVRVSYRRLESLNLCGGFLCFLVCVFVVWLADGFGRRAYIFLSVCMCMCARYFWRLESWNLAVDIRALRRLLR